MNLKTIICTSSTHMNNMLNLSNYSNLETFICNNNWNFETIPSTLKNVKVQNLSIKCIPQLCQLSTIDFRGVDIGTDISKKFQKADEMLNIFEKYHKNSNLKHLTQRGDDIDGDIFSFCCIVYHSFRPFRNS